MTCYLFIAAQSLALIWALRKIQHLSKPENQLLPFVFGSNAYGENYRTDASDIDIMMLVSREDIERLRPYAKGAQGYFPKNNVRVKHGPIDFTATTNLEVFLRVRKRTQKLKEDPPIAREVAVQTINHGYYHDD